MTQQATSDKQKATSSSSSSKGATSMADLMSRYQKTFNTFRKGDQVKGHITKLTRHEILVDINAKAEAMVLEKDKTILDALMSLLHVGDEVTVGVLNPESENGNPVVSLRRFIEERSWDILSTIEKNEEQLTGTITDITKGGLIVATTSGLSGFLPNSHTTFPAIDESVLGKSVSVSVLELNRKDNKIIFSQKGMMKLKEFEDIVKSFKNGEKVHATVSNITPYGVFVSISGVQSGEEKRSLDGLVHISEIAWEKVDDIASLYTSGQELDAVVIGIDREARRIDLSVKKLTEDPFGKIAQQFPVDTRVSGTVLKMDNLGVVVRFNNTGDSEVTGTIRKEKIPPTTTYKEGDSVNATVTEIDTKRHRIYLSPVLLEKPIGYR